MIYLLLVIALLGFSGFLVYFYNQVNATGLPRLLIKFLDKGILLLGVLLLGCVVWQVSDWLPLARQQAAWTAIIAAPLLVQVWLLCGTTIFLLLAPSWAVARPIFGRSALVCQKHTRIVHAPDLLGVNLARKLRCRILSKIPGNQIFDLAIESKELIVIGLPPELDGLKIAHLSDLHLTGQIAREFHALASDFAARWQPDVAMLSGDLIDNSECIAWLSEVLRPLACPLGQYFLLGNHDRKVPDPNVIRREMQRLGWVDVAGHALHKTWNGCDVELLGSEVPWFGSNPHAVMPTSRFRILLSHSPDQITWARLHGVSLMLAGHTHGGQGRLPLVGPVLSPSKFGSRFASGEFYVKPTTLHVTRGVSGAHLLRINCRPEISLLMLRVAS